jgi:hypothetical protein
MNERKCTLRMKTKFINITFINVHAPTEDTAGRKEELLCSETSHDMAPNSDVKFVLG